MNRTEKAIVAPVVAITGGIACGKSEVGRILARRGVNLWDADNAARALTRPGHPLLKKMTETFGPRLLDREGRLNRSELARMIFENSNDRARLNALLHPKIAEECNAWRTTQRKQGNPAAALIPLLFEAGLDGPGKWDAVICVSDRKERVLRRLAERGLSRIEAEQRISAQWPLAEKEKRADTILYNHAGLKELEENTLAVWLRIVQQGRHHHA